jgi:hypothetical protein
MTPLETLTQNGYLAQADGAGQIQIQGASGPSYYYRSPGDFAADKRTYHRDATPSLAVLACETTEPTALFTKFAAELVALLAPADRLFKRVQRPLIRQTAAALQALYRADGRRVALIDPALRHLNRVLFEHGVAFRAATNGFARATLEASGFPAVPLDGGEWLGQRSPLNTPRADLPFWNGNETAQHLRQFVDRWVTAGELQVLDRYLEPPAHKDMSPEAELFRQGVGVAYSNDDVPAPVEYSDPRLRAAFGVPLGVEPQNNGFAARRRG